MAGMKRLSSLTSLQDENDLKLSYLAKNPYGTSTKELEFLNKNENSQEFSKTASRKCTAKSLTYLSLDSEDEENGWNQNLELGIQWFTLLTDNLLSHPFIVLQRQCQVFNESKKYHLSPITLIPSIINLHRGQKITTLWKGLGSCLLVRGMTVAIEDVMCKFLSWPKMVYTQTSLRGFGEHILLKCVSIALVTPFLSASLVETVQSDIASEKPNVFDVFREGFRRILCWTKPKKGRIIPLWILIGPNIFIGLGKHILRLITKGIFGCFMKYKMKTIAEKETGYRTISHIQNFEMYSNLFSIMFSNVVFYPFETVLYRLQLQGTRTIIDNLDNGCSVVPILTSYHGAIDCYKTTISSEGVCGLYKGFGAVIFQFAVQIAIIKFSKWSGTQIASMVSHTPSSETFNSKLSISSAEILRTNTNENNDL